MKNTIKFKMLKIIVPVIVFILLVSSVIIIEKVKSAETESNYANLVEKSSKIAMTLNGQLKFDLTTQNTIAKVFSGSDKLTKEEIDNVMKNISDEYPNFLSVYAVFEPGEVKNFNNNESYSIEFEFKDGNTIQEERKGFGTENWYQVPKRTLENFYSEPYFHKGKLVNTNVSPIIKDGKFVGVVGVEVNLDFLDQFLSTIKIGKSGYVFFISPEGLFAAHPTKKNWIGNKTLLEASSDMNIPEYKDIANDLALGKPGQKEIYFPEIDEVNVVTYSNLVEKPWGFITVISKDELLSEVDSHTMLLIYVNIFILLLIAGALYYMAQRVSKPIEVLANDMLQFSKGDTELRSSIKTNDEVGDMANSFNQLADNIGLQLGYLNKIPTPVMIIDKDFNVQYMNETGADIVGRTVEECKTEKCYNLFNTGHCRTEECRLHQAMKYDEVRRGETDCNTGKYELDIMYTGAPVKDKNGEIIGALEYVADISDIKDMQRYLNRSTSNILTEMEKFAEGDLTVNVKAEKEDDDIGKLFAGFNKAVNNIQEMIQQVTEAVQATASASNQISSSTEELAAGAQEQSAQSVEIATAIEEMTATILETNQNVSNAAETAKGAGNKAEDGVQKINVNKEGMNKIESSSFTTAEIINSLSMKTDQIGEITQVIDDIADQTNLLALNAAIEAARAGDQGRGFAVVADEVRKLAERTTKATKEIAETIKGIQIEAKDADTSMLEAKTAVENGMQLTGQVSEVLNDIYEGSSHVVDVVSQVASASEQQSSTAEEISKNIEGITSVTQQSAAGTQQIARAAEDLNRLTENLQTMIGQFITSNKTRHSITGPDEKEFQQPVYN